MITVAEAAEHWGISVQLVRRYCREKRIPEAVMYDGTWFIPDDVPRPDREESESAAMPPNFRRLRRQRSSGYADLYFQMEYASSTVQEVAVESTDSWGFSAVGFDEEKAYAAAEAKDLPGEVHFLLDNGVELYLYADQLENYMVELQRRKDR